MSPQPLARRTGARVFVGGYGMRLVDADTGMARPVGGIPADARHTVSELVPAAGVVYVLLASCDGDARVYRVENDTAHPVSGAPVDDLLAGTARVWAVDYPAAGAAQANRVVLPVPPSDIAVLHLDTGRLEIVPGLELAPKTGAGLAFAADGSWVFVTVSDGDHTHLLGWHSGLGAPQSVARLSGPVPWAPPLLIA